MCQWLLLIYNTPPPQKKKISRDRSRVPDPCRLVAAPCGWHARPAKHELSVRCDFLGYGPLLKREFRKWCSRSGLYNCFKMFCSHWNVPFFPLSSSFFSFLIRLVCHFGQIMQLCGFAVMQLGLSCSCSSFAFCYALKSFFFYFTNTHVKIYLVQKQSVR